MWDFIFVVCHALARLAVCYWVPWARAADGIAIYIVYHRPNIRGGFWYISLAIFCSFAIAHVLVFYTWYLAMNFYNGGGGLLATCVCDASEQQTRHRFAIVPIGTQNLVTDTVSVLTSLLALLISTTYVLLDLLMVVWHFPVASLVFGVFLLAGFVQ